MAQTELDWEIAKRHFDLVQKDYRELENTPGCNTTLALAAVFAPLERRYSKGERTQELWDEMIAVE